MRAIAVALAAASGGSMALVYRFDFGQMIEQFGEDACDKKKCKLAIRQLIDSGRCIYSYVGGSYVTLPPES